MNYFGLFFTFMIPGILMGIMAASVMLETIQRKQRAARRVRKQIDAQPVRGRLYIHSMKDDQKSAA